MHVVNLYYYLPTLFQSRRRESPIWHLGRDACAKAIKADKGYDMGQRTSSSVADNCILMKEIATKVSFVFQAKEVLTKFIPMAPIVLSSTSFLSVCYGCPGVSKCCFSRCSSDAVGNVVDNHRCPLFEVRHKVQNCVLHICMLCDIMFLLRVSKLT